MPAIFTEGAALIHRALTEGISSQKLTSWNLTSAAAFLEQPEAMEKSRKENKAPVTEDGVSAGETQQDTQSWPEFQKPETSLKVTQSSTNNVPWNFP